MTQLQLPLLDGLNAGAQSALRYTVIALMVAALGCVLAMSVDSRLLDNGDKVWLKPLRFCIAFGVHLLTIRFLI